MESYIESTQNENLVARRNKAIPTIEWVNSIKLIKQGIWLYFLLLIFEGALRKWFLPSISTPLLIIRDPIALWLVLNCWHKGLLQFNLYMSGMMLIGLIGLYTAFFLGHGNLLVAAYGARVVFLNIPLLFVIGKILNRIDVIKVGKVVLWLTIPMAILIALQFYSPQSAWVNRGVGGDTDGAGFGGALGYFRPPGTFSFTNGTTLFFGLAASYIFYFWTNAKCINRLILILATVSLLVAIPLSISRALFFQVGISILFAGYATVYKKNYIGKMILATCCMVVALLVLSKSAFFSTSVEAFTSRFENANETEGGLDGVLGDRFLGGMVSAVRDSSNEPFFGYGMGMGTNVGSMLLDTSRVNLNLDQEWARLISELGPVLGIALIFFRLGLAFDVAFKCYRRLLHGDLLPWMLLSFGFLSLSQGQWAQPTSLGFFTLIGGLLVASLKSPKQKRGLF